ncbi:MAG: flavodoxin [Desulfobacteraceae bacterium]|jgi:flavodoxin short chain
MGKALILYGSTTGNTEEMSEMIKGTLSGLGLETEMKNVLNAGVEDLKADHDLVLLGCPAYGDDAVELQEDFQELYENLDGTDLSGRRVAVFAPGDSSYDHFCGSVDVLEEKMTELGATLVVEGLKVDGDPADEAGDIAEWAESAVKALQE